MRLGRDNVEVAKDKVLFMTEPKDEIKNSYEQNTSKILTPNKGLITETNLPKLMQKLILKEMMRQYLPICLLKSIDGAAKDLNLREIPEIVVVHVHVRLAIFM